MEMLLLISGRCKSFPEQSSNETNVHDIAGINITVPEIMYLCVFAFKISNIYPAE